MIDKDKGRRPVIRTVPGHGELSEEDQQQIAELMDYALSRDKSLRSYRRRTLNE